MDEVTNAVEVVLAPLAAFWVLLDGMMKMVTFVNGMRDVIITGVKDGVELSNNHRRAIFTDWKLSMVGFVGTDVLLSGVVFSLAKLVPDVRWGIYAVSLAVLIGAILFVFCGVSDYKAINSALSKD